VGRQQALELLVRVWQRSDQGALSRAAGDQSLLVVAVPIEALQEDLPALKAQWHRPMADARAGGHPPQPWQWLHARGRDHR